MSTQTRGYTTTSKYDGGLRYAEPQTPLDGSDLEHARMSQEEQLRQYQMEQQRLRMMGKMQQERQEIRAPAVAPARVGDDAMARRIRELEEENARLRQGTVTTRAPAAAPDSATVAENAMLRDRVAKLEARLASQDDRAGIEREYVQMAQQLQTMEAERSKLIALSKSLTDNLAKLENLRKRDATQMAQLAGQARGNREWEGEALTLRNQLLTTQTDLERQQTEAQQNLRQMADEQEALGRLRTERDSMAQQLVGTTAHAEMLRRQTGVQQMNMAALTQRLAAAEQRIWQLTQENDELRDDVTHYKRKAAAAAGPSKAVKSRPRSRETPSESSPSGSASSSNSRSGGKFAERRIIQKRRPHRARK